MTAATAETENTKNVGKTAVRGHADVEAPSEDTLVVDEGKFYGQSTSNQIMSFVDRSPVDQAGVQARMIQIVGISARDLHAITVNATKKTDITRAASIIAVMRGSVIGNEIVKGIVDTIDAVAKMIPMTTWRLTLTFSLRTSRKTKRRTGKTSTMKATCSSGMVSNGYQDNAKKLISISGKST